MKKQSENELKDRRGVVGWPEKWNLEVERYQEVPGLYLFVVQLLWIDITYQSRETLTTQATIGKPAIFYPRPNSRTYNI